MKGSEGEERGATGGVRGDSGWQRRLLKLHRSLGTSEPCSTPPPLLLSSPSPSMWGKPPGVSALRFPWALTCGPLTLLCTAPRCYCLVFSGILMENKIIFCREQNNSLATAMGDRDKRGNAWRMTGMLPRGEWWWSESALYARPCWLVSGMAHCSGPRWNSSTTVVRMPDGWTDLLSRHSRTNTGVIDNIK